MVFTLKQLACWSADQLMLTHLLIGLVGMALGQQTGPWLDGCFINESGFRNPPRLTCCTSIVTASPCGIQGVRYLYTGWVRTQNTSYRIQLFKIIDSFQRSSLEYGIHTSLKTGTVIRFPLMFLRPKKAVWDLTLSRCLKIHAWKFPKRGDFYSTVPQFLASSRY